MMPVEWTRSAVADVASIYEYIAKDSERYAISVVIYLVKKDTIYVLAVVHGARLLPEKMPLPEGGN
jgi:plasmid stabilization system protein ParE